MSKSKTPRRSRPRSSSARKSSRRRAATRRPAARRRNPGGMTAAERRELAAATRISERFHGSPRVLELSAAERRLPRFVALIGDQVEASYAPDQRSKKGGVVWRHRNGDRGALRSMGRGKSVRPKVVALPNGRVVTLPGRSPQRFDSGRGIVD
jgi:hypothetical protein